MYVCMYTIYTVCMYVCIYVLYVCMYACVYCKYVCLCYVFLRVRVLYYIIFTKFYIHIYNAIQYIQSQYNTYIQTNKYIHTHNTNIHTYTHTIHTIYNAYFIHTYIQIHTQIHTYNTGTIHTYIRISEHTYMQCNTIQ